MKVTTSLLMICMLAAAGAAGKSEAPTSKGSITSMENLVQPSEDSAVTATQGDAASQWRYLPVSTYVAPKVPI